MVEDELGDWTACADRLPDMNRDLLVWGEHGGTEVAVRRPNNRRDEAWDWLTVDGTFPANYFTHWRELQGPPMVSGPPEFT